MDELPDALLLNILSRLDLTAAVAVGSACTRFASLVGDAVLPATATTQQSVQSAAAAARQALHAIRSWRDALLLSAWQHQHNAAAAGDTPAAPPSAAALQHLLQQPVDAAAAFLEDASLADQLSALSLDPPQSGSSSTQSHLVEFSSFWLPSASLLEATSCLVTDGHATTFMRQESGRLVLLKGHLPPADASPNAPLSWLQRSSCSSKPAPLDSQHGVMHLLAYLQHAWSEQASTSSHISQPQRVVLRPPHLPSGSISGLAHPWPSTATHDHRLLRDAVVTGKPVLLLPAGAGGCGSINGLGCFLADAPSSWLSRLSALDVSGQLCVSDAQLAAFVSSCAQLTALSLAESHAASRTFMMLGTPTQSADSAGPGLSSTLRQLNVSGCAALSRAPATAGAGAAAGMAHVFQLFMAALARLTRLDVLLARRLNVDAALACHASTTAAGSSHVVGTCACSYCSTLGRLVELDVSGAVALSPSTLAQLLLTCRQLRRFHVAGSPSLAAGDALGLQCALRSVEQQQQREQQQHERRHTGLTRLGVGWGWSSAAIGSLVSLSPLLMRFSAGVGASINDSVLEHLAAACPHLQTLHLSLCAVSDAGVGAVLAGCRKLTTLQLQSCVGPFDVGRMVAAYGSRWQLTTLQLTGATASGATMLQLLGANTGRPYRLANLALTRVTGLTDTFLRDLAAAACPLQNLRLEDCSMAGVPSFDTQVAKLVAGCCMSLQTLTLRHSVSPLPANFVESITGAAPLLKMLCLDACDMAGNGFGLDGGRHAALTTAHVCRCRDVDGCGVHQTQDPHNTRRRMDAGLTVHLLLHGRSLHLPAG